MYREKRKSESGSYVKNKRDRKGMAYVSVALFNKLLLKKMISKPKYRRIFIVELHMTCIRLYLEFHIGNNKICLMNTYSAVAIQSLPL